MFSFRYFRRVCVLIWANKGFSRIVRRRLLEVQNFTLQACLPYIGIRHMITYMQVSNGRNWVFIVDTNLHSVTSSQVIKSSFPLLRQWQRSYTIDTLLNALRQEMASHANRRLPQPPEGDMYWFSVGGDLSTNADILFSSGLAFDQACDQLLVSAD